MATNDQFVPTVAVRCDCGKAYYDTQYIGEPCRDCGVIL
jgi:hypothetical protein